MAVLESMGTVIIGKATGQVWDAVCRAYEDWRRGRQYRLAMAFGSDGSMEMLPQRGSVTMGTVYEEYIGEPIVLSGAFVADESTVDLVESLLHDDEKVVLFMAFDEEMGETLFVAYGFSGYAMGLWPGLYSFYAFIVDPVLDEFLAIGYPAWGDLRDPNPIELTGEGGFHLDFMLFDADDFDYP